jgi:phosphonate transport system substrate-binding protein
LPARVAPAFRGLILILCAWAAAGPAQGDPSGTDQRLLLGVFPRHGQTDTQQMFAPLAARLANDTDRVVRLEVPPDFVSFWAAMEDGRFDIAHSNQYDYVRAHARFGYNAIAKNEERGRDTLSAVLAVRADSGIREVEALRGRRIIFGGGPSAMMSYIGPRWLLEQAGLVPGSYVEQFSLTPPKAVEALYYRQGAAAGLGDVLLEHRLPDVRYDPRELRIIARTPPMAHLPWSVASRMPRPLIERVQSSLFTLGRDPGGRAALRAARLTGIVPASDADYDGTREMIQAVLGEAY